MHYNIITRSSSLTIFYNLYSWMAHEILIELFSPGDVLSRFCSFFRVSFQNFLKEFAQVQAKSQWLQLEDFSPEWFFGCLLKSFQKKKCSFWWQKVDFARQSFLPFKLLISPNWSHAIYWGPLPFLLLLRSILLDCWVPKYITSRDTKVESSQLSWESRLCFCKSQ